VIQDAATTAATLAASEKQIAVGLINT
jgi:hypothetical protein